jgi:hypothetical protein
VRQLAAALPVRELARALSVQVANPDQQAGLTKSGSKLPHSKAPAAQCGV